MPSVAQTFRRNKRESLEAAKRRAFEAQVNRLVEAGSLDSEAPMAERVHKVMLANRPFAAPLPEPLKVEAPAVCPKCQGRGQYNGLLEETGTFTLMRCECVTQAEATAPLYDLLIAIKKYGVGSNSRDAENAPITWIKFAGEDKRPPKETITIAHPAVQKFLMGYDLVATECKQFEVIRKYKKIGA